MHLRPPEIKHWHTVRTSIQGRVLDSNSKQELFFSIAVFFPFCLADVNQSLYPFFSCFYSRFKIPEPSGLYLRTHPPPRFSWYRCGLFIKVRQQEIPQIFRGPCHKSEMKGRRRKREPVWPKSCSTWSQKINPEDLKNVEKNRACRTWSGKI